MKSKKTPRQRTRTRLLATFAIGFALNFAISCGTSKVVFVDTAGGMVRIGPDVRGHVYFYQDGEWILSRNKVTLPEGWFAGGIDLNDNNKTETP